MSFRETKTEREMVLDRRAYGVSVNVSVRNQRERSFRERLL